MAGEPVDVDLEGLQQEIGKLSPEELKAQLLGMRVRQKVQQGKQKAKGGQKAYQMKARERQRLLKQKAIEMGIYDEIDAEAKKQADAKLEELFGSDEGEEENESS